MVSALTAAASGIDAGMSWLSAGAGNVANAQTPGYRPVTPMLTSASGSGVAVAGFTAAPSSAGGTDLASALPDTMLAGLMVQANAAVLRTVMKAYQSVVNDTSAL